MGVFLPSEINFSLADINDRTEPNNVLMCSPEYFDVVDVKNVHMQDQLGKIDRTLARQQWDALRNSYTKLKQLGQLAEVHTLPGIPGLEDMVFAANQSFPWTNAKSEKLVIISKMRHSSRQREIQYFRDFYQIHGYKIIDLKKTDMFEGMGDAIPMPGKNLIFGGYGHRTDISAYSEISEVLNVPIIALKLINDKFYHLDTCFVPLSKDSVMLYPGAFQKDDLEGLKKIFKEVIEIPEKEAAGNFSLNAHVFISPQGKSAILQKGSPVTTGVLRQKGFEVIEIDTSEYIKSGGSVFCMKMMIY